MSNPESDPESDPERDAEDTTGTDLPPTDPGGELDALEKRTLDEDKRPAERQDERQDEHADDGTGSAFDIDLDPEDQGRADTGEEQSG